MHVMVEWQALKCPLFFVFCFSVFPTGSFRSTCALRFHINFLLSGFLICPSIAHAPQWRKVAGWDGPTSPTKVHRAKLLQTLTLALLSAVRAHSLAPRKLLCRRPWTAASVLSRWGVPCR